MGLKKKLRKKPNEKYMKKLLVIILLLTCINTNAQDKVNFDLIGRFHYEGAVYFKDVTPLSNGTGLSDLRLGTLLKYGKWNGKIEIGFTNSKIGIKDVFAKYSFSENLYIKAGHYPEPFGLDYMESSSKIRFLTASATTQAFAPLRNLGVKFVYTNYNIWTALGVFGDGDINNSVKGNDGYAGTGRIVYNPFRDNGRILHIGMAGSLRKPDANGLNDDGTEREREVSFASTAETFVESTKFLSSVVTDAKNQFKCAVEFITAYGPFSIQSEYMYNNVKRNNGLKTYSAQGVYGQIGFIAIGSDYPYSPKVARLGIPNPGSLEFVARYNFTDLNSDKANIYGGKMNDISLAVNYYINKYFAVRLNYVNVNLDKYAANGKEKFNIIQARMQLLF